MAASYPALIELRVNGITQVTRVLDTIQKLDAALVSIKNTPIAIDSGNATDGIRVLKKEYMSFVAGLSQGKTQLASTTAGINQQAAAMRLLAANAKIGGQAFNLLVQGAEQARQKVSLTAGLAEIAAVASQVKVGRTAPTQSFRGVEELLKMEKIIPKNTASLKLFQSELLHTISFVDIGGKDFQQLSQAIDRVGLSLDLAAGKARKFGPMLPPGFTEQGRKFEANAYPFPVGPSPASTRRRFSGDTSVERAEGALRTKELQTQRALNVKFFAEEKAQVLELDRLRAASAQKQTQRIQGIGKAVQGSLSSAAIGGAFPLLFGQSPQAAVGGAIGGLLGGAGGGFAGSLLGTALGELEAAKARTKELAVELGLSSTQAKTLATAFELAGRNSQQLEAAVTNIQGLGLSTKETASAIKIAVELSKEYGGSVEKIAQAFADTLESGKVSVSTLNKFTAQGIPIQDQLAEKLGVSRTKLLEMAKDGKISVQQVTDVLVDMGQEAEKTADKGKTGFDRFVKAVEGIATAIASATGALLKTLVPALDTVLTKLSNIITRATQAINLLTDAQVGEASAALARSGMSRGTLFANRGNIDDLTQGLKSLQPLSAKTTEQFDRIADTAQRYRVELSKYGGSLGEYAVGTAQVELTRVTKDLAAARKAMGAPARPDAITGINAPANLPPSGAGAGKSAADKAADDAAREAARVAEIVRARQLATLELQRQAVFSQKIAEAEMAKDPILARQLQGQQDIMQLGIKIASELEKEKNTTAQLAMAREFQAKKALALLGIEIDIAKIKQQQTEQYNTIISDLDTELALKYAITEQERTQLRIAAEMRKLQLSDPSLTEPQRVQIQQAKERLAAPKTGRELVLERTGALEDELKSLTDVGNVAITVADGIGSAFATSFKGIISGSMTAKEALANFFTSVADMFLDMAAQIITKMITMSILNAVLGVLPGGGGGGGFGAAGAGFGGSNGFSTFDAGGGFAYGGGLNLMARANGGPVSSGQTYMVGERGPELFVPGRSGTIVANDKMGGGNTNVVVNVDAKGSSVEGDEQGANQLGRVISAAVQSELIKQQRPGGILAR